MSKFRAISILFAICFSLHSVLAQDAVLSQRQASSWADALDEALIKNFWGASFKGHEDRYFFNKTSHQADMGTGDYWPQAHAIDVVTDAYLRTGQQQYRSLYEQWWQGMPKFNFDARRGAKRGDLWWNAYVDDMEWHCLALIRIYEATKEVRYLNKARQLYADWIWTQWSPEDEAPWYGGITWKTDIISSKNACSNGPAAIVAARLAIYADVDSSYEKARQKDEYLNEARRIYQWERQYLWDAATGAIYDSMNSKGKVARFSLSYNQGTFIGAAVELYRQTGQNQYLEDAILTARYTIGPMSRHNGGVLPDATEGDGGLFNGIFFRYLANLVVLPDLPQGIRRELTDYLYHSATVMTGQGINPRTHLYGGRWHKFPTDTEPCALTSHLTACMLLEAVCKVMESE